MTPRFMAVAFLATSLLIAPSSPALAQGEFSDLNALVDRARAANPEILAADRAVDAARNRATAAGILPDPRLAVGLMNAPVSDPLSSEIQMTMRTVQLGLRLPYPGKLGREREAARHMLAAAEAERRAVELEVVEAVRRAYYEIWLLDRSTEVVRANREILGDFVQVTEARYGVGTGEQQDILKAQVERTRLGDELLALQRRRDAAGAELNALLERPATTPIESTLLPEAIERAAIPAAGTPVRFTAAALEPEDGAAGPIPDLATLQAAARVHNPRLAALDARVAAQRATAEMADLAAFPDFDLTVGYGQRGGGFEDLFTVLVSAPLPVFKGRKQDPLADAAGSELARLEAKRTALAAAIEAEVAALYAALVRERERLALSRDGVLPQARASLESAVAAYRVARVDFLTLLDNQVTLFRRELDHVRLLADFGKDLAAVEGVTGTEVLR